MRKKIFLAALIAFALIRCIPSRAALGDVFQRKILILYHERIPPKAKFDAVSALVNQLSHFDAQIVELQSDKYQTGMINYYDAVFYLGMTKASAPRSFCDDVVSEKGRTVCWIYDNIIPLTSRPDWDFGFTVQTKEFGFNSLNYKGFSFNRTGENAYIIEIQDRKKAKPYGALFRKTEFSPYAVNSGNFWYVSDLPFFLSDTANIFCDLLHDVLKEDHAFYKYAVVRIEDIHPERDNKQIRDLGAVFVKHNIPFCFGVIPVYKYPDGNRQITLSDRPYVASALRYLESIGGTAILHGYTHQYARETGEGHEFWDIKNDAPIPEDSEDLVRDKLRKGIKECVSNGIYPLAWETPHYGASQLDYRIFSEFFSTAVERIQLSDRSFGAEQNYPYFIKDKFGRWIVPENLGYISYREGRTVERMLEEAKKMLVIRDAVAVGFIHAYVEPEHLDKLITGLREMGYTFLDLRDLPNQVKTEDTMLFSGLPCFHGDMFVEKVFYNWPMTNMIKLDLSNQFLRTYLLDNRYSRSNIAVGKTPDTGEVFVQIPEKKTSIFVVRTFDRRPTGWEFVKGAMANAIIGADTVSPADSLMRILMWAFFLVTIGLLAVLAVIYVYNLFAGKKK